MCEFTIKSCESDIRLVFSNYTGKYFDVAVHSDKFSAIRKVYVYTDVHSFATLMERLASYDKPWSEQESWCSLESEFEFIASCDIQGHVSFRIELNELSSGKEYWVLKFNISSEFGQLPALAKSARIFFSSST